MPSEYNRWRIRALRLRYAKGPYGPYAENLKNVLTTIDTYFIRGYGDATDVPDKPLEVIPDAARLAERFLMTDQNARTREHLDRVADLIEGFETSYGMELLSTVHWLAHRENVADPAAAVLGTYQWNARKKRFTEDQIRLAWRVLDQKGWLNHNQYVGSH